MLEEAIRWLTLVSGVAGVVLIVRAWLTRARGERRICPGYAPSVWGRVDPRRALLRYRCGYDLTGVPQGAESVRCPECGRARHPRRLLRCGRRVRIGVIGAVLVGLFWTGIAVPWGQRGRWVAGLPTLVLVTMDGPQRDRVRRAVRVELNERVTAGSVHGMVASLLASRLAEGLRDDEHRRNADRAQVLLDSLWPASRPALEAMLTCGDAQGRVLASSILRERCVGDPSPALLEACIADIGSRPAELDTYLRWGTCGGAAEFLLWHEPEAAELLERAMRDADPHRRLIAAAIVAWAGDERMLGTAAPILISHLADNRIEGDAKLAAPALYRLGPGVAPLLREHADSEDAQLRRAVRWILARLERPDAPANRLGLEPPLISRTRWDPLDEVSLRAAMRWLWF
ncbi:MAG: hypothetical protein IPJ41_16905 [Phycisphaerales bacterium]|nr:hypothetical protein [Phycisphaerales bacterium]